MKGLMEGLMEGWMEDLIEGWMKGWMEGWMVHSRTPEWNGGLDGPFTYSWLEWRA